METNKFIVIDETGVEIEMEILFTFQLDNDARNFVLYTNPADDSGEVIAAIYDEDGKLSQIESAKDWAMVEEVFNSFMEEQIGDDDEED